MAGALFLRDAKKQGFEEGFAQGALFVRDAKKQGFEEGIAQQKAEDEKILQETVSRLASQKDENRRLREEISRLKAERSQ